MNRNQTTAREPQTAAYQAAVDNVWFENRSNAREIQVSWNALRDITRWDYAANLEDDMRRALGVRYLDYDLS